MPSAGLSSGRGLFYAVFTSNCADDIEHKPRIGYADDSAFRTKIISTGKSWEAKEKGSYVVDASARKKWV